jgi:hypothetical protein
MSKATEIGTIEEAWDYLADKLARQGWPPDILEKMRLIYCGGASVGVFLTIDALDAGLDRRLFPLLDEIRRFADEEDS